MLKYCIALLLLSYVSLAHGFEPVTTQYRFDNISAAAGLSNLEVKAMAQDNDGFIWVGTLDGLYRFDGYSFKVYRFDPDDPHTLPGNVIESLLVDSQGRLWIGTEFAGLAMYHSQTETFSRFNTQPSSSTKLHNQSVFALYQDTEQRLWLGSQNTLTRVNLSTGQFDHYPLNLSNTDSLNKVQAIVQDSLGQLWLGTSGSGLVRFDPNNQKHRYYRHNQKQRDSLSHDKVRALHIDKQGNLWVGTQGGGLNRFDPMTEHFERFHYDSIDSESLGSDHIYALFEDDKGNLWVGTRFGGLSRYNPKRRQWTRYQHNPQDKFSIGDNDVFAIIQDNTGLIWLGLFGSGIAKFDPQSARFGMYQYDAEVPGSLTEGYIHAIYKDIRGTIWVGTESGLNRYNRHTGQFLHFKHEAGLPGSLSDDSVLAIGEDTQGNLWVGTQNGGLNRFNPQESTFTHYQFDPNRPDSLSNNTIKAIVSTPQGTLWIATAQGLNRYNPHQDNFSRYIQDNPKQLVGLNNINTIAPSSDGILWLGTHGGGLSRFDSRSGLFSHYLHDPASALSLSNNTVFSLYQSSVDQLWIGTLHGLNKLDVQSGEFLRISRKQGLVKDRVTAVLGDAQGYLWLGEGGISRMDRHSYNIKNHIGLQARCTGANQGGYFQAKDGQLFFASENRFCAFYPEQVLTTSQPPKLVLLDFQLQNKSVAISTDNSTVLSQSINHTGAITLSHDDKLLSFEFAALHYADPKKNQYEYQLQGFDNEWLQTRYDNRRATYSNLSPGHYVFRVRASNHEGIFVEQPRAIELFIRPPPWASWWAYTLYIAFLLVILGAFAYMRNLRQKALVLAKNNAVEAQQNAELARINAEKANKAKSAFLANVSHEIRTPLNAVLGHTQILARDSNLNERQRHSLEVIARSSDHLLELINNILDISKIEADEMQLLEAPFELVDLIKGIGIMFQNRAREKNLGWEFINECRDDLPVIGDQGKLRQVLINLLGNALKFTYEGGIILQLSQPQPNSYRFSIIDSGVGIDNNALQDVFKAFGQTIEGSKHGGTGLGLAIAYRQVALMGGTLQVDSKPGFGSHFYFTLPLAPAAHSIERTKARQLQSVRMNCGHQIRALVVDDIKENRDILCRMLQDVGITTEQAEHGQQALDMLNGVKTLPQLVFMDIRMPIMDGESAVKAIHRQFKQEAPACVVVTAHALRQDVERYLAMGFDYYIAKPFRFETIYECIFQLLDVELEYASTNSQNDKANSDDLQCEIPEAIYQDLYQGASDYEITRLERGLSALAEHCPQGEALAKHLKSYLASYDMESLLNELEKAVKPPAQSNA